MFDEAPPANTYSLTHYIHRFTWALLLFCSVGLLASSVYRAATFPFTHDESLSFAIFSWEPGWGATANNHLLNTFLMKGCSLTFGNSELSLRLLVFLRNEVPLFALFLLMLTSAAALPILEHRLFYTLFPIARAALYYVSLYVVVLLSGFHVLTRLSSTRWNKMMALMAPATIAMALGWHFYRSFNTHFVYAWPYDAHNDEILQIIDRDREHNFGSRTVNLGNSWNMEPSLNFYRVTHNYTWLAPVTQKPISNRYNDYIYAFLSEIEELSRDDRTRLASYADTQTVLLRVNHAHKSWPLSSTLASESEKS